MTSPAGALAGPIPGQVFYKEFLTNEQKMHSVDKLEGSSRSTVCDLKGGLGGAHFWGPCSNGAMIILPELP